LLASVAAGMFGGFRSALLLMVAVFLILYTLERMWQSRLTLALFMAGLVGLAGLVGFSDRLPLSVQRTISFLPLKIDPATKDSADFSTKWRVEMWKTVLPEVPKHLIKGKGYSYSADGLFMAQMQSRQYGSVSFEEAAYAGAYHNGLLSVIIPFGAAGLITFVWLLAAGTRFLYTVYQSSAPELRQINRFLLALFLARILFFFFIFGSLYTDLFYFTGILGFSMALNVAGKAQSVENGPEQAVQESTA
jgi:O-antigen ligase